MALKRRVLIECGVAETRAILLHGDDVIRFWFGPARGDEGLLRPPAAGDLFLGRIRSVSKPLAGAFVDIGAGDDAFLPLRKGEVPPVEGARTILSVRRAPLGRKGAVLSPRWTDGLPQEHIQSVERAAAAMVRPGALGAAVDALVAACAGISARDAAVIASDPLTAVALKSHGVADIAVEANAFERHGANAALEEALLHEVAGSDVRLIFDEAEALTAVDVDAGVAADGATGRLNDKVNLAAVRRLPAELSRRAIGGRIVIDFLPPSDAKARAALLEALKAVARGVFEMRVGKLSADGLLDLMAPRRGLSLLALATEPAGGGDWPVAGRRFTLDWRAKTAMRSLERALSAQPRARLRLVVGGEIDAYLNASRSQWAARLQERYGARFEIRADERLEERGFDLAE